MYVAYVPKTSKKAVTPSPEGLAVQRLRQRADISQTELGRRIGVHQGYISQIESGEVEHPSGILLYRIAQALGAPLRAVFPEAPPEEVMRSYEEFRTSGLGGPITEWEEEELLSAGQILGVPNSQAWLLLLMTIRAMPKPEPSQPTKKKRGPKAK